MELFADFVDGNEGKAALAVGSKPLGQAPRLAIGKTLESFGYGRDACTFAALGAKDPDVEGGDAKLDPQSLFLLVEALDPLLFIVADEACAHVVAQAYRTGFNPDEPTRIFGRPTVVFADFEALLETDEGKQKAWSLLKSLPKR